MRRRRTFYLFYLYGRYGPDLYIDKKDKERLGAMTEFQRELLLAERAEKRDELTQQREIRVQQRQRQEAEGGKSAQKQKATRERSRAPVRAQVRGCPLTSPTIPPRVGDLKEWYTVLIAALGSWGKPVPRGHAEWYFELCRNDPETVPLFASRIVRGLTLKSL
jgi:hypothetical protein